MQFGKSPKWEATVTKIVDEIVTPKETDRATEIDGIDKERQDRREAEVAIEEDHEIGKDRARREEGETARERVREGENRMTISMRKWNASDKKTKD